MVVLISSSRTITLSLTENHILQTNTLSYSRKSEAVVKVQRKRYMKAKKHKAMAAEARAAWKALKRKIGGQLWLRHVVKPGEHQWARGANVLAGRGKQGTRTQVEHMRR